ncbi:MAG: hypothetical protein AAGN64_02820 [Bacteroidota bacterium]
MPRVLTKKPSVTFTVPGEGDIRVWRGETIPDRWYEHVAEADKSAFNSPSSKAAKKVLGEAETEDDS